MSIVLIVDDDPTAREALVAILEGEGYELQQAKDGVQALRLLKRLQPDLILLDVMMPAMDGFEVCRRIRATPPLAEVPIILLTALDDADSRLRGIESGADDFLSKPPDRRELVARVRTITRLNRYRTLMEQRENIRRMAR
jgi:DNA-binding response OmpR family regulator